MTGRQDEIKTIEPFSEILILSLWEHRLPCIWWPTNGNLSDKYLEVETVSDAEFIKKKDVQFFFIEISLAVSDK